MKKKLIISMLATLLFSLMIITTLFVLIVNSQYIEYAKGDLKSYNNIIINMFDNENISDKEKFIKNSFKNSEIEITLIDYSNKTIYSNKDIELNYNNESIKPEILDALSLGYGNNIRYRDNSTINYVFYATKYRNRYIIRSSIPLKNISGFEGKYVRYYIIVMIIAFAMSLIFSSKISYVIVKPIKDLQYITSRIAKGDLDRRVNVSTKDEIGKLGITFNNMADKLQVTINEVVDKQNRLEAILKSMDSGVIAVDKNNKVIMVNPYAKEIFGINKNIIGLNLMDCIRDFELDSVFKDINETNKEIKILWPKERELRIKTAEIINFNEKIGKVAVVQDISDIKKLENMRTQFVTNVSHELKTPLTSIKGFAETLRYVEDKETRDKFLNIIDDESDRLTRLINDILILSDLENNKEFKIEDIDVNNVIKDVIYLVRNAAEKKNITINSELNVIPIIKGDKDKFKQMLINLVDNSVKYTDNGGHINIGSLAENNNYKIWVEDTGVGIPREHIERLFERFYRVDKARSRVQGGTGLGLAIVKHIVLSFNGTIDVESELGKGSKFTVKIPF